MIKPGLKSRPICSLAIALLMLVVTNASAQETNGVSINRDFPKSMDALATHFSSMDSIEAVFVQSRYLSLLKKPLISEGLFNYSREKSICWRIFKPVPAVVELTPSSVRVTDISSDNKLGAVNPAVKHFSKLFFAVFSGDFELLQSDFDIEWSLADDHWIVVLKPKGESVAVIAEKFIIKGGLAVSEVALIQHNGDKTLLSFDDVETASAVTPATIESRFECKASEV